MIINIFVLISVIVRIISILGIIALIPYQMYTIYKREDEYRILRWVLLLMSFSYVTLNAAPFIYQTTRLNTETVVTLQNIASLSSTFANVVPVGLFISIYVITFVIGRNK